MIKKSVLVKFKKNNLHTHPKMKKNKNQLKGGNITKSYYAKSHHQSCLLYLVSMSEFMCVGHVNAVSLIDPFKKKN